MLKSSAKCFELRNIDFYLPEILKSKLDEFEFYLAFYF